MHTYKRALLYYGLRTLLLLAVVENIGLVWLAVSMHKAGRQREARETLQSWHWAVLHEYRHDSNFDLLPPQPAGPTWLRNFLGVDFFNDVTWVRTQRPEYGVPTDADFDYLASFPHLRRLDLGDHATDGVLTRLQGMQSLEWLEMKDGKITDAGLGNVERLNGLRVLLLSGTPISDDGLKHLRGLSQLRSLDLARTRITDAGVQQVEKLRELKDLDLSGTRITDAGLEHLKDLAQLTGLSLHDTQVTDQGVRKLQQAVPNCLGDKRCQEPFPH